MVFEGYYSSPQAFMEHGAVLTRSVPGRPLLGRTSIGFRGVL